MVHRASRSGSGHLEVAVMWTIVAPDGTPHDIAGESALSAFARTHNIALPNLRHHLGLFAGNGESVHVKEYILLEKLQWMQRKGCSEFVPVLGGVDRFVTATVAARSDMPFQKKKLREHLSHARKNGPALKGFLSDYKWQVVAAPLDPRAWLARAGTVPTEPEDPVAAPSTAAPPAPAADSPAEQQAIDAAFDASQLTLREDDARRAAAKAHDTEQLRLGLARSESQARCESILAESEDFLVRQLCAQTQPPPPPPPLALLPTNFPALESGARGTSNSSDTVEARSLADGNPRLAADLQRSAGAGGSTLTFVASGAAGGTAGGTAGGAEPRLRCLMRRTARSAYPRDGFL